jgi:hypothetical protein
MIITMTEYQLTFEYRLIVIFTFRRLHATGDPVLLARGRGVAAAKP